MKEEYDFVNAKQGKFYAPVKAIKLPDHHDKEENIMQPENSSTAHRLYALYETLPKPVQQDFLQELLEKQQEQVEKEALYLACRQAKEEDEFLTEQETQDFINRLPQ
jgi:hypothetical protein